MYSVRKPELEVRRGSTRWYDNWSRYLAVITAGVTLVTSSVTYFTIGKELGGVAELVTACITLVGFVIALQLEVLFRVSEKWAMHDEFSRLLGLVEDFPDLTRIFSAALTASVSILRTSSTTQFHTEVINILKHADGRLQELAQGRMRVTEGDSTLTLAKAASTRTSLQGTTDQGDTRWWLENSGVSFFNLNAKLIQEHDVTIERVWLLTAQPDADTCKVMEQHREIGVNVYVLRADRIELDRRLLVNMTIMDGIFLHEDIPNRQGDAVEYLYSENSVDIERAKSRFAQLKSYSVEYTDQKALEAMFER